MTNETLIRDITDPVNQLVSYGSQQIGFYDGFKPGKIDQETGELTKGTESCLYIYINNGGDKFTTIRRKSGKIKIKSKNGNRVIEETKAYARAFQKYLDSKNGAGKTSTVNNEAALLARIAELEAAATKPEEEVKKETQPKIEKSVKDLKAELDALEVDYKGNASRETLLELIATNKE